MIKIATSILLLLLTNLVGHCQFNDFINTLNSCSSDFLFNYEDSINFPKGNNHLKIPKKWKVEFKGELKELYASKKKDSSFINIRANQAWNVYGKDELFEKISEQFEFSKQFNYLNHKFSIYTSEDLKNSYDLYYHLVDSEKSDNKWTWHFKIRLNNNFNDLMCEFKFILDQIIKEYDNN